MELNLTGDFKTVKLTHEEVQIVDLFRQALSEHFADIGIVVHQGKLVSASVTKKYKF